MKSIITLLALIFTFGCSSKPKDASSAGITAPAPVKTEAPAVVETKTVEAKPIAKQIKSSQSEVGTTSMTCKSGSDERVLAINVKDAGCELVYTKNGEAKTIATQIKGSEKCEEVMTKVKENLTAAGFSCP